MGAGDFSGNVYNIHMEAVNCTLKDLLWAESPSMRGATRLTTAAPQHLQAALVAGLARMRARGLVHGDLHMGNIGVRGSGESAEILLIDFGQAAAVEGLPNPDVHTEALRTGHEYDVMNLLNKLFESFEELNDEIADDRQKCKRRLVRLERRIEPGIVSEDHRLQEINQVRAYLAQDAAAHARTKAWHDGLIQAVAKYVRLISDWRFDGLPTVRNRSMRSAVAKRLRTRHADYFESDLYWGDFASRSGETEARPDATTPCKRRLARNTSGAEPGRQDAPLAIQVASTPERDAKKRRLEAGSRMDPSTPPRRLRRKTSSR